MNNPTNVNANCGHSHSSYCCWILLLCFMSYTRFYDLASRPMHHDESLYAKQMLEYYQGNGFVSDPMTLGPFIYHIQLPILFVFGISETTMRILPALTGVLLICALFMMRHHLPDGSALTAGWLYATNPVIMYYQRFLRQDAPFLLFSLLAYFFLILWLKYRNSNCFIYFALSVAVICCIKFEGYLLLLILFIYGLIAMFALLMRRNRLVTTNFNLTFERITADYPTVILLLITLALLGAEFCLFGILIHYNYLESEFTRRLFWCSAFAIDLAVFAFYYFQGKRQRKLTWYSSAGDHVFYKAMGLSFTLWILMYTTFFFHPRSFWTGVYGWFLYWCHLNSVTRAHGPFSYFFIFLFIFAFIPMLVTSTGFVVKILTKCERKPQIILSFVAVMLIILASVFQMEWLFPNETLFNTTDFAIVAILLLTVVRVVYDQSKKMDLIRGSLLFWVVMVFLFYSIQPQKVPWLMMPILTPMILLASIDLMDFYRWTSSSWTKLPVSILLGIMMIATIHLSVNIVFRHPSDPTWQLNYVHTTDEIPKIVEELQQIAFYRNDNLSLPIIVDGTATWPIYWYLRDWKNVSYGLKTVDPATQIAVITDLDKKELMKQKLGDKFLARTYTLRNWYLPTFNDMTPGTRMKEAWRWFLLGEKFKPSLCDGHKIVYFLRKDVASFQSMRH